MTNKKLSDIIKKALSARDEEVKNATLGDHSGTVLTGLPYEVYARVGNGVVIKIRNYTVPNTYDLRVKIGKEKHQDFWQVISYRDAYVNPTTPNIPHHDDSHRYLPVYRDQIVNLNGYPVSGALSVQIMGSDVIIDGVWVTVPSTLFDLTTSLPTVGARWVLFQFHKTTGVISTVNGSLKDSREILTNADIPLPSTNNVPFLAVRMYGSQTQFLYKADFVRPFNATGAGAAYLDDLLDVEVDYPTDGQILTWDSYTEMWINADAPSGTAPSTTAVNDFQVGNGAGAWIKKTLAETITILRTSLDSIYAGIAESIAAAHISDTSDAHDASAISVLDTGGLFTATDVEAALAETQATIKGRFYIPFGVFAAVAPFTTTSLPYAVTLDRAMALEQWVQGCRVAGTSDASNYWTILLRREYAGTSTTIATIDTKTVNSTDWKNITTNLSSYAVDPSSNATILFIDISIGAGAPGNLYLAGTALEAKI